MANIEPEPYGLDAETRRKWQKAQRPCYAGRALRGLFVGLVAFLAVSLVVFMGDERRACKAFPVGQRVRFIGSDRVGVVVRGVDFGMVTVRYSLPDSNLNAFQDLHTDVKTLVPVEDK